MKKKSTSSKSKTKSKKQQPKKYKQIPKKKIKSNNQAICQDYIIVNGNIYQPITHTQRDSYQKYIHELKSYKQTEIVRPIKKRSKNLEEYVRMLSRSQKMKMLKQLQHQIGIQKIPTQVQDPLIKIQKKIQKIKMQLHFQSDIHSDRIAQLYYNGVINQTQKDQKINMVLKIKQHKLQTIDCIVNLFKKIINNAKQQQHQQEDYTAIINSLNSLEQLDKFPEVENAVQSTELQKLNSLKQINKVAQSIEQNKIRKQIEQSQKIKTIENKIFIRQEEILIHQNSDQNRQNFQCNEISSRKLIIPILMTKDKIQQLQQQKKIKEVQTLKGNIQRRIEIQLSCFDEGQNLFTTLADVNRFIVNFYEFCVKNHAVDIVGSLNNPYGKSVIDKIYALQNVGMVYDQDLNDVLIEQYLEEYQQYKLLNNIQNKEKNQYERIHNKAVFDCFNKGLNAYRPYYQIQGQLYPWIISEKGVTFYEINEENVEQVFEKTKIKVLEYCSSLCGLMLDTNFEDQSILQSKRAQLQTKSIRSQIQQDYHLWPLNVINYDTMCRLIIAQTIFNSEIILMANILQNI